MESTYSKYIFSARFPFLFPKIWPQLEDFFNIHKWIPAIVDTCYGIEGISGQPGCIRYCGKKSISDDGSGEVVSWAKEKLLSIDPNGRCLRYSLLENNIGFESHIATMKLLPSGSQEQEGCEIIWSFSLKPIEEQSLDDVVSFYGTALQSLEKQMEENFQVKNEE